MTIRRHTKRFFESTTKTLPVELYEAEVRERAFEAIELSDKLDDLRLENKAKLEQLKAGEKELEGKILSLRKITRERKEDRVVPCQWHYDLPKKRVFLIRLDTNAIVEESYMTDAEYGELTQLQLPLDHQANWEHSPVNPANIEPPPAAPAPAVDHVAVVAEERGIDVPSTPQGRAIVASLQPEIHAVDFSAVLDTGEVKITKTEPLAYPSEHGISIGSGPLVEETRAALAETMNAPTPLLANITVADDDDDDAPGALDEAWSPAKGDLKALLKAHEGNLTSIARIVGVSRDAVRRRCRTHDLDPADFRK